MNDWLIRRIAKDWVDFEGTFGIKIEEFNKAAKNIPISLLSFLGNPFPVLYVIDTDKQEHLPAIPGFFADSRDQLEELYAKQADEILLRNPFIHRALPLIEGRRIKAIVIPDEEKSGPRFQIIQRQVRRMNPSCEILSIGEFYSSSIFPASRVPSCEVIYLKEGITKTDTTSLINRGDLIPVIAPKLFDPGNAIGEEYGLYALSEYHPPRAAELSKKIIEGIVQERIRAPNRRQTAPYATAMY